MRGINKLYLTLFIFLGIMFISPRTTHAQTSPCIPLLPSFSVTGCIYGAIVEQYPEVDIIRTMVNSPTVVLVNFLMSLLTDQSWDELLECTRAQQPYLQQCRLAETSDCGFSITKTYSRGNGSLFGLGYKTGYLMSQPDIVPVNLALWFKDEIRDIPVVGDSAFAQSVNYPNVIAAEFILTLWRQFRNLAYGFLSLVMIVVGIMIMLRKKVNPQMVITMQNSIPRIIIALILITFSYPIGATAASFTGPLMFLAGDILSAIVDLCAGGDPSQSVNLGGLFLMFLIIPMAMLDSGALSVGVGVSLMILVVMAFGFIITMIAFVKMLLVYIRILASIVFAPITFAIGAIPGNEQQITDWFKMLAARVLSIPAMFFLISLAYRVPLYAFVSGYGGSNYLGFGGTWVAQLLGSAQNSLIWAITPFIMFMILGHAISAPKKVEEMFMGPPNKRR